MVGWKKNTKKCINRYGVVGGNAHAIEVKQCIEIVIQLAEEYNNGWIACSERLPEKDMWCLAIFENGNVDKIQYLVTNNWGWNGMRGDNKVIAWMPLPAPYQKGE